MDWLSDYTLRTIGLGAALLGAVGGMLGSFAVLRRQALLGDVVSHAALPGIVAAFWLSGSRAPLVLVIGAALSGLLAAVLAEGLSRRSRLPTDTTYALLLAAFFGLGMLLLSLVQRSGVAGQAGLSSFLFGQAAAIVNADLQLIALVGLLLLGLLLVFWKEFTLLSFDPQYALSRGYPLKRLELLLNGMLVTAVVIGLQLVGVVLMSALLTAPAVAARQWSGSLAGMTLRAGLFGAAAGLGGAWLSTVNSGLATGPLIVVLLSAIVAVSLIAAPQRGLLVRVLRRRAAGREVN
jgi:manganese/zinc/iron transport system permease protein